ncbi:MAG: DNA-3-methyladenine glycosylase family protein [Microthrixaceae bacterium]
MGADPGDDVSDAGSPDAVVVVPGTAGMDLMGTCRPMADGAADPTWRFAPDRVARAFSTPVGPVAVELDRGEGGCGEGDVVARCWGDGTPWVLPRLSRMLGEPAPADFRSELHPLVHQLARRHDSTRFGASLRLRDVLVPTILGQRVTSMEARRSWWQLVRRHGSAAPGPLELLLPPTPSTVVRLSDADWHRLGVERQRADAIRRVHGVLGVLEAAADAGSAHLQERLCQVPGIGPWTATGLAANVLGDQDAVLLGDLHVPHNVCFALAGEPRGSDERMLELLEPWRGYRARVTRLLRRSGRRAPRRGPRYRPLPISSW